MRTAIEITKDSDILARYGGEVLIVTAAAKLTIPAGKHSLGETIKILRDTIDTITIEAGTNVTLKPGGGDVNVWCWLEQMADNEWVVWGDLM